MTTHNASSKETAKRARAIAMELNQGVEQRTFRMRNAMILLALTMFASAMSTHAFAAGRGFGGGGGFHGGHMRSGFHGSIIDTVPSMPAPKFNRSDPYTVHQSPETPVSPASPGSIFGNG
jgi:hypothetical protein